MTEDRERREVLDQLVQFVESDLLYQIEQDLITERGIQLEPAEVLYICHRQQKSKRGAECNV